MHHGLPVAAVSLRATVGRIAGRVFPGLEEYAYNRDRSSSVPGSFVQWTDATRPAFADRPAHVVIAPLAGPLSTEWGPARGNYYYEIYRTAVERFGPEAVSVLELDPVPPADWGDRLRDFLAATRATHLIAHMERDPGDPDDWTWDSVWSRLAGSWDGVFVGVTFDSGFSLMRMKARGLRASALPSSVWTSAFRWMISLVRGRPEVGPVPLVNRNKRRSLLFDRIAVPERPQTCPSSVRCIPTGCELDRSLAGSRSERGRQSTSQ